MQQWYNCPGCGQYVHYGQTQCLHCGFQMYWQQPAPAPYPPNVQDPTSMQSPSPAQTTAAPQDTPPMQHGATAQDITPVQTPALPQDTPPIEFPSPAQDTPCLQPPAPAREIQSIQPTAPAQETPFMQPPASAQGIPPMQSPDQVTPPMPPPAPGQYYAYPSQPPSPGQYPYFTQPPSQTFIGRIKSMLGIGAKAAPTIPAQQAFIPRQAAPDATTPKKKDILMAYLYWLCLGCHYLYLEKRRSQIIFWLTLGGCGIWWIIDLFRLPGMVKDYNIDLRLNEVLKTQEQLKTGNFQR